MIKTMPLPLEILALVFSYLPEKDLDNVQLVCRSWKDVANDNIWKEQFFDKFGTNEISPVLSSLSFWRRELITRTSVLHKWKKCSKETDITLNSTLIDNTEIYCSFGETSAKAVCFNSNVGAGNIVDLSNGKIKRRFNASRYRGENLPVPTIDGSRFGLVFGFLDGGVSTVAFSRDGTTAAEFNDLPYKHASAVSAAWIAKSRNLGKSRNHSIGIATGAVDGQIYLNNAQGANLLHPENSKVLLIEGSMSGSHAIDDGDVVVAYYANRTIYKFNCTEEKVSYDKLTTLEPTFNETIQQLHLCNNYVVLQAPHAVFLVDIKSGTTTVMELPRDAEITCFSLDKSSIPGTKYMAAGLSTNEICVWAIPAMESTETATGEAPRIELVIPKKSPSPMAEETVSATPTPTPESAFGTRMPLPSQASDRIVKTQPLWIEPNPIGYEHRLTESNKPQITQLALNSAVLLIGGYNGLVMAVNLLTGSPLKKVNSRISKNVLDIARYSRDGFVPVTHIEIDPDPLRIRCLIAVRPAVQFLDLGSVGTLKRRLEQKRGGSKSKRRANVSASSLRHDMEETLEINENFALLDAEREEREAALREQFMMGGDLEDEEQLAYAMMLSRSSGPVTHSSDDDDEDLRRALEQSIIEENGHVDQNRDDYDDDEALRATLALSLQDL